MAIIVEQRSNSWQNWFFENFFHPSTTFLSTNVLLCQVLEILTPVQKWRGKNGTILWNRSSKTLLYLSVEIRSGKIKTHRYQCKKEGSIDIAERKWLLHKTCFMKQHIIVQNLMLCENYCTKLSVWGSTFTQNFEVWDYYSLNGKFAKKRPF